MKQTQAQRRLVKSPPELWAQVSSEDALARRLAQFGEIRITRVEPETTVAWEGDRASGTVQLEPSDWGTKVILTATSAVRPEPQPVPEAIQAPPPPPAPEPMLAAPAREPRHGLLARLLRRRTAAAAAADATPPAPADSGPPALGPEPPPPAPDPAPTAPAPLAAPPGVALDTERTAAILSGVLDDLGAAHHRPFARD